MRFRHQLQQRCMSFGFSYLRLRLRAAMATVGVLVCCACMFGQNKAAPSSADPKSFPPAALPRDQHSGLTISVDPYTEDARTKDKFAKANPHDVGVLPVEVFLRNDTDQMMRLNLDTIQLEVTLRNGVRQQVDWMRAEEVANLIAHPTGSAQPQQKRLPLPLNLGDKKTEKLAAVLRPLTLDADIIPPKATIHGFLYFNVSHEFSIVKKSSLYVPDVTVTPSNDPLVYFEVPLRNAGAE